MIPSDFEPYLFLLESINSPTQTTTIIDTDYNNWAVIYNCGTYLDGLLVFDDYIVLSKNSVNYNLRSSSMLEALVTLFSSFPDLDENTLSGPNDIHDNCP